MLPVLDHLLREQANINFRRRRWQCRESFDINIIIDNRFKELFRVNKALFQHLCEILGPHVHHPTHKDKVSVEQKILVALRFYAFGGYQRSVGGDFNMAVSQTSAHRYIHEVTNAINEHLAPHHIKYPQTQREINRNRELFMQRFNFPGIVGAVDGTHRAILKPAIDEHAFINRKGFHSLNALVVCNAELKFMYINANYPGSHHDSFIWRQSYLRQFLCEEYQRGNMRGTWLIGDFGYPLEPFLLTPHLNPPENSPEARYNHSHIAARNSIERAIGVLKSRFRCVLRERVARYSPNFVGRLFNTCATLHNMCIDFGLAQMIDLEEQDNENQAIQLANIDVGGLLNEGRAVRNRVIEQYFQ